LGFRLFVAIVEITIGRDLLGERRAGLLVAIAVQHWFGSLRLEQALDT
jgi:hypothetical protein